MLASFADWPSSASSFTFSKNLAVSPCFLSSLVFSLLSLKSSFRLSSSSKDNISSLVYLIFARIRLRWFSKSINFCVLSIASLSILTSSFLTSFRLSWMLACSLMASVLLSTIFSDCFIALPSCSNALLTELLKNIKNVFNPS